MTSLLDVLKETDIQLSLTNNFMLKFIDNMYSFVYNKYNIIYI